MIVNLNPTCPTSFPVLFPMHKKALGARLLHALPSVNAFRKNQDLLAPIIKEAAQVQQILLIVSERKERLVIEEVH